VSNKVSCFFGLIPIEERLPRDGALCLCNWVFNKLDKDPPLDLAVSRYCADTGFGWMGGEVTHWAEIVADGTGSIVINAIKLIDPE
jgi:hypothetical protein